MRRRFYGLEWLPGLGTLALLGGTVAAAACGGDAIIADGMGGSTSASSGTGASTSTSSSSSGPGAAPPTFCGEACEAISGCLEPTIDCEGQCLAADACLGVMDGLLECVSDAVDPGTCAVPPSCQTALEGYVQCRSFTTPGAACYGVETDCQCEMTVGMDSFESSCQKTGPLSTCTCIVNGQLIGTCSDSDQERTECDPFVNCCATLISVTGLP